MSNWRKKMDSDWEVISKRRVLDNGKFCTAEYHTIKLPDGRIINNWSWLIMPDFVNVVVVDKQDRFIMLQQSKYGVEGTSIAPVGGFIESGEDPLKAAKRETQEELGYEAPRWIQLGSFRVDPNRGCGTAYTFLAVDAEKTSEPDADDLEQQKVVLMSRNDVEEELLNGGVKVLSWANNIALSLLYLDKEKA